VKPRSKVPLTEHGVNDATTDEAIIRKWWREYPDANIGVATGSIVVIDVDGPEGERALASLIAQHGPLPETLESRTGRLDGGRQLFFAANGYTIRNSAGKLVQGLDVRGQGGYVVAPRSIHPSGKQYEWIRTAGVAPLPKWIEQKLRSPARSGESSNGQKINRITAGRRNDTLASLAGTMRARGMSHAAILAALQKENESCDPPLPETEVRTIAASIARYEPENDEPDRFPVTESSNAERLFAKHGNDLRYCSDRKIWCVWNGTVWAQDEVGGVMRRTQDVVRDIYREAAEESDEKRRKALGAWAKQSDSRRVQENSVALARFLEGFEVREFSKVFDTRPLLFNVSNGTIDLQTGELHPHRREDFLTKMVPIAYDPGASCPKFMGFLNETFPAPGLVGYITRFVGYALTGLTSEQIWLIFCGLTASGKSTLVQILHGLLGPYAHALPENYFLLTKNAVTDFATANLAGIRLATCVETNEGRRLDVAKIKMLTGEDAISAALKYQNYFTFRMQAKLLLATNHPPRVPASDDAIWRRLKVVPFTVSVPEKKRIPELAKQLLEEEGPGILRWAVMGCQGWFSGGLSEPDGVTSAVGDYRAAEDVVQQFLAECCVTGDSNSRVLRRHLFAAYTQWAKDNGFGLMTSTRFAQELGRIGVKGDDGRRFWLGIAEEVHP